MRVILIGVLVFLATSVWAQPATIEGTLLDAETNLPVAFASVGITGYAYGTSSNADGSFTLKVPDALAYKKIILKVTCVGYDNFLLENPGEKIEIRLRPSKTFLSEIVVSASVDASATGIVKKAFAKIRKNYNTKPFIYQTFYRHYCKDDDQYGRLIEAAVDIYKRKGYKVPQSRPGERDEVKVMQLRRSFDNTKVTINHAPIALYNIMLADEVAYQTRTKGDNPYAIAALGFMEMSALEKYQKLFEFNLDKITSFDNEEVFQISYRLNTANIQLKNGNDYPISFTGMLYINTRNFAFVKTESKRITPYDTLITSSSYHLHGDKYYLYHSMREGKSHNKLLQITHQYHIELLTTNILTKGYLEFKGREPDKEQLFYVPYNPEFWDDYNIIKATPLEESITADLEKNESLNLQFQEYMESEREKYFSGKEDEARFNKYLTLNKGRVIYIAFWKSDCGACLRELEYNRKWVEKYKNAVAFIYVSLDDDLQDWKAAMKKHKLNSPLITNYRVGSHSDVQKIFSMNEVPRYVLVNKSGSFAALHARQPTDPDVETEFIRLLAERFEP